MRRHLAPILILVVGALVAYHSVAGAPLGVDYPGSATDVDRSGAAIQALVNGKIGQFLATQPPIGPVSVLLRAPAAALATIGHGIGQFPEQYDQLAAWLFPPSVYAGQLRLYQFGAFPCLLALVLLGAACAVSLRKRRRSLTIQLLVGFLVLALPLWSDGLSLGHPEEFLTTALTLGAVLASFRKRDVAAGVLMGLALASKQWALLALVPLVAATPLVRLKKTLAATLGVYLLVMLPLIIGAPARVADIFTGTGTSATGYVDPHSIWFPLAHGYSKVVFDGVVNQDIPTRVLPHALAVAAHPFIVLVAVALSVAFYFTPERRNPRVLLQLVALIFLLRCVLDPVDNIYYHAPFLAALAIYEGHARRGLPVLTMLASVAFLPHFANNVAGAEMANVFYLCWTLPLVAWLAVSIYMPHRAAQLAEAVRLRGRSTAAPEAVRGWSHGT